METFDEQEEAKHEEERHIEFVPEDREGEERLGNEHPCLVVKPLGS